MIFSIGFTPTPKLIYQLKFVVALIWLLVFITGEILQVEFAYVYAGFIVLMLSSLFLVGIVLYARSMENSLNSFMQNIQSIGNVILISFVLAAVSFLLFENGKTSDGLILAASLVSIITPALVIISMTKILHGNVVSIVNTNSVSSGLQALILFIAMYVFGY